MEEFKERIILETRTLIQRIEELCTSCLSGAKVKAQYYMNLLQIIQSPIALKDLEIVEGQLKLSLSLNIPTQNFKEILNFYNYQFLQESNINNQRLEELKSKHVDYIKEVLAQEFHIFVEVILTVNVV